MPGAAPEIATGGRFGAGFRRDFASSSQRVPGGESARSTGTAEFGLALNKKEYSVSLCGRTCPSAGINNNWETAAEPLTRGSGTKTVCELGRREEDWAAVL